MQYQPNKVLSLIFDVRLMTRSLLSLCIALVVGCATRTPLDTPVPFRIYGHVITADGQLVAGALVELSEEHSRLFPILIAPNRKLGQAKTDAKGGFSILVTTPLQSERLNLFVNGRTYNLAGANVMTKRTQSNDSVYTMRVRVPGPNVIRVRRGFIPGPEQVTVERLPRF
jgi:hypothetical protein